MKRWTLEQLKSTEASVRNEKILQKLSIRLLIGIDPGVKTGLAIWNIETEALSYVKTFSMLEAMQYVHGLDKSMIKLFIEDARLRKWFGGKDASYKAQGAGSVKRDASLWEEFCKINNIAHEMLHPIKGATKLNAEMFSRITGWKGRTSEHARDAAMIVFQRRVY